MELIRLSRVEIGYQLPILPPLDLVLQSGDRIGILGPNGAGKSTLLKTVIGLLPPLSGTVSYPAGKRPRIGYVPQSHRPDTAFPLSTFEVVLMGRYPALGVARRPKKADRDAAMAQLEAVGLTEKAKVPLRALSGGQRQRAMVARALVGDPELLVLDEPTSEMDPVAEHSLLALVEKLAARQKTGVLFVTHEISAAAGFASTVALVDSRQMLFVTGPAETHLSSASLSRLYGRTIEIRREEGRTLVWIATDGEGL